MKFGLRQMMLGDWADGNEAGGATGMDGRDGKFIFYLFVSPRKITFAVPK
jgi:hypothetical protein